MFCSNVRPSLLLHLLSSGPPLELLQGLHLLASGLLQSLHLLPTPASLTLYHLTKNLSQWNWNRFVATINIKLFTSVFNSFTKKFTIPSTLMSRACFIQGGGRSNGREKVQLMRKRSPFNKEKIHLMRKSPFNEKKSISLEKMHLMRKSHFIRKGPFNEKKSI